MKLVMTDREKVYFQKLPKDLRVRIAHALSQPELVPPDGRRTRSEALRAARSYEVTMASEKKPLLCTLENAAAHIGWRPEHLAAELAPSRTYGPKVASAFVGGDEVTVRKVKPH